MPHIIIVTFVILIVTGLIVGNYFYGVAVKRSSKTGNVLEINSDKKTFMGDDSYFSEVEPEHRYIQSGDGLLLHGMMIDNHSGKWVIICHPYRAGGRIMGNFAKMFGEIGFSTLTVDLRGHGASEGKYIGMGWHDSFDILAWIKFLNEEVKAEEILLFGISMGASAVMMTLGHHLPDNVKGAVEDCGYSSVKQELKYVLKKRYRLPPFPIMNFADIVFRMRAGYSILTDGDAVAQVKKKKIPLLFIHGESDKTVPMKMMDKLYKSAPGKKEKLKIPKAGHAEAVDVDEERYRKVLYSFVFQHFNIAGK